MEKAVTVDSQIFVDQEQVKRHIDEAKRYTEEAKRDLNSSNENPKLGLAEKKLIEGMNEYFNQPELQTEIKKKAADTFARSGAPELFKIYFDIFVIQLEKGDWLESSDVGDFEKLLEVCLSYCDLSIPFSEAIASSGILDNLTLILQMFKNTFKENFKTQGYIILNSIAILYNCSISSNNKRYYKDTGAVELIGWYAKNTKGITISHDDSLSTCCILILAHITDEDDNDMIMTDHDIIENVIGMFDEALANYDLRSYVVFSAKELALGLTKLANNDQNSLKIVQRGAVPKLMELIEKGCDEEQITAVDCIWTLSFVKENRILINNDQNVVKKLKDLSSSKERALRCSAIGALWQLGIADVTNDDTPKVSTVESYHVMLSYNWDNQTVVLQVKEALEGNDYKVWMDLQQMKGDTLDAMADAVEQSAVVLICMSQKYKDSQNCRAEAEYAYRKKKPIIPLKLQKGYSPNGWLGLIVGTKLYYDFAETTKFDDSVSKLVQEIGDRGRILESNEEKPFGDIEEFQLPRESNPQPLDSRPSNNPFDIQQWAQVYGLQISRFVNIDLETLEFLKTLKSEAPEYFYRHINQQLGIVTPKDLMLFTKALKDLH